MQAAQARRNRVRIPIQPQTTGRIPGNIKILDMIVDEMGVQRHTFSRERLERLSRDLNDFFADCTPEEYREIFTAACAIKTMIHQRQRQTK